MNQSGKLHLFQGYGVELEYMIVDRRTLDVAPLADRVLQAEDGTIRGEVEVGPLCWSNELVQHVIELKTNGPAAGLAGLAEVFQQGIRQINRRLEPLSARLLPGGMHPWMDPLTQTRLWPHGDSSIYQAYNRIFDCRGHGWSNLQSTHLNLPFQGDEEFGRLHAAIRLLLPLLPALAASSPIASGCPAGILDYRLQVYRRNQQRIPRIAGQVIPEPVFHQQAYQQQILQPLYDAIAPLDPDGLLQYEWLNSRGAIARFQRDSIEIRLLDIQECPQADVAIIELLCAILQALVEERWCSFSRQKSWRTEPLAALLAAAISNGEQALIEDTEYLSLFGLERQSLTFKKLLQKLASELRPDLIVSRKPLAVILDRGSLARRILAAVGSAPTPEKLLTVYRRLGDCLAAGEMFQG